MYFYSTLAISIFLLLNVLVNRQAYVLCHCFQFDAPLWDDVSDAAKDLVQRMLTVDHTQRITIQDVLNHRWIRVSCLLLRVSVAD